MTEKPFDGTVSMQYGCVDDSDSHDYHLTLSTTVSSLLLGPISYMFDLNYFIISYILLLVSAPCRFACSTVCYTGKYSKQDLDVEYLIFKSINPDYQTPEFLFI